MIYNKKKRKKNWQEYNSQSSSFSLASFPTARVAGTGCGWKYLVSPLLMIVRDGDDVINDGPVNWLFLFSLFYPLVSPARSPCRLDCLTCSSHLATYSITSPADSLLITHHSGLQARADCSCLIDSNWRVVTLCSFKNKCFYSRDSSVWLVISILRLQSTRPVTDPVLPQVQHENQTEINLLFLIMKSEEGWWRWLHPVDSGHILSPISTCWSLDPPTAPIIRPVTQLCSLEISSNGCTRIK